MPTGVVSNTRWTRRAAALLGAAVTALLVLVAVLGMVPEKADAASRFRTVTKTFINTAPITIPANPPSTGPGPADPYPSTKNVSGLKRGKILDVNLTLRNLHHDLPDNVAVLLQGPRGQDIVAMSDVGGTVTATDVTLVLDDQATAPLPDSSALSTGTFKPTQGTPTAGQDSPRPSVFPGSATAPYGAFLSDFDGTNPNGTWKLFVYDDTEVWNGSLNGGWSITIKARALR